jgi:hypothetical protein
MESMNRESSVTSQVGQLVLMMVFVVVCTVGGYYVGLNWPFFGVPFLPTEAVMRELAWKHAAIGGVLGLVLMLLVRRAR